MLQIKRGSSLLLTLEYADELDRRIDLTGYELHLAVRTALGALVDTLTPMPTGRPGQAIVIRPDTGAYPPGLLSLELSIGTGGITSILQTSSLTVQA